MQRNLINDSSIPINKTTETDTFDWAKPFRCIVVTGCQRSGTSIASKMIAHSLGRELIDEDDYGTKDYKRWISEVRHNRASFVIQSPAMSRFIENVALSDVLIVYMLRNRDDVQRSIERIDWKDWNDRVQYPPDRNAHIYDIKKNFWQLQKNSVMNWVELNYEGLASHNLWIKKDKRKDFQSRQTKEKNEILS